MSLSSHIQSRCSSPADALPPLLVCREEDLSLPICFSLLRLYHESWIPQLTFQFFSKLICEVALKADVLN
ncbi:hypothetical protein NQZ68_030189 [Dissostichus eleginoides]|nr:hypothetical protein NQZ68_030189 [Dissostichus eleginoides]